MTVETNASHFGKRKTQCIATYITKSSYLVISAVGKGPRAPLYCFVALSNRNERTMLSYKRGVSPPDGAKAE